MRNDRPVYVALSNGYGGDGVNLDYTSNTQQVMEKALAAEELYMVHVIVDPEVKTGMAFFKDKAIQIVDSG